MLDFPRSTSRIAYVPGRNPADEEGKTPLAASLGVSLLLASSPTEAQAVGIDLEPVEQTVSACQVQAEMLLRRLDDPSRDLGVAEAAQVEAAATRLARGPGCVGALRALAAVRSRSRRDTEATRLLESALASSTDPSERASVQRELATAYSKVASDGQSSLAGLLALDTASSSGSSELTERIAAQLGMPQHPPARESTRSWESLLAASGPRPTDAGGIWIREVLATGLEVALAEPDGGGLARLGTVGAMLEATTGDTTAGLLAAEAGRLQPGERSRLASSLAAAGRRECAMVGALPERASGVAPVGTALIEMASAVCGFYAGDLVGTQAQIEALKLRLPAVAAGSRWLPMRAHWILGVVAHALGSIDKASGHYDEALELAISIGADNDAAALLFLRGELAGRLDEREAAAELLPEALASADRAGARDTWHACALELARLAQRWNLAAAAREIHSRMLARAQRWGDPSAIAESAAGLLPLLQGDGEVAARERVAGTLRAALSGLPEGSRSQRLRWESELAISRADLADDPARAAEIAQRILRHLIPSEHQYLILDATTTLAEAESRMGRRQSATSALRRAATVAERLIAGATEPKVRAGLLVALEPELRRLLELYVDGQDAAGAMKVASLLSARAPSVASVLDGSGLVIAVGTQRIVGILLARGDQPRVQVLGSTTELMALARDLDGRIEIGDREGARQLASRLASELLPGTVITNYCGRELMVLVDRRLLWLPWALLGETADVAVAIATSSDALRDPTLLGLDGSPLLFAASRPGGPEHLLAAAPLEEDAVKEIWGVERQVTRLEDATLIHIAAHHEDAVALLRPPNSRIRLPRRPLLWLGSCRGIDLSRERLDGLVADLLAGGARAIVAAGAPVEDDQARELAVAFHRGLRRGLSAPRALLDAFRTVRQAMVSDRVPMRWARFVLVVDSIAVPAGAIPQEAVDDDLDPGNRVGRVGTSVSRQ